MVTLCFTLLFVAIVVINALIGLVRGLNKSTVRVMHLAVAAALTFAVAGPITELVADLVTIEGKTLGETVLAAARDTDMLARILDSAPLLQEALLVAPTMVMSIAVFPVVFLLLDFIGWIVYLCINKRLRRLIFKESCKKGEATPIPMSKRFAGMGVGVATGVLFFGLLMAPAMGLFSVLPEPEAVDQTLEVMQQQELMSADEVALVQDVYDVTDCVVVKFYNGIRMTTAGRTYINYVSEIKADGQSIYLTDEFDSLLSVFQTATETGVVDTLVNSEDPNAIYTVLANQDTTNALMQKMFQSRLLCSAVPEVTVIAMEGIATNMNVPANKAAVYNNMMDNIAQAIREAGIDYAAIEAYEQAQGNNGSDMTQAEYEAELQKLEKLTKAIAAILNKALSGDNATFTNSVAQKIVTDVQTRVAQEGHSAVNSYNAVGVQNAISNMNASDLEAGEADAKTLLGQLADPAQFKTDVPTVETITTAIRASITNALADPEKSGETATTLSTVVSNFAGAVANATDKNGKIDVSKLDYGKIAEAVSTLQNSALKDVGSSVLDMVASGDLGSNSLVGNVITAVKDSYDKGEDISGTINTAGALIGLGNAMNGGNLEDNEEAVVDSLLSLIENLDETTIKLLPSIVTSDMLVSVGVPEEFAPVAYDVIETLLEELMNQQDTEDYEEETDTILYLYNLATSGVENMDEAEIVQLLDDALASDAIFNTLMSISTSNPFGIEIPNPQDRAELVSFIENYYAQSGRTQREYDACMAVANLLGLDEVELG